VKESFSVIELVKGGQGTVMHNLWGRPGVGCTLVTDRNYMKAANAITTGGAPVLMFLSGTLFFTVMAVITAIHNSGRISMPALRFHGLHKSVQTREQHGPEQYVAYQLHIRYKHNNLQVGLFQNLKFSLPVMPS
jgi:hypothetical protein